MKNSNLKHQKGHNLYISVIIPVYNAASNLRRAVSSVLEQEVVNEIILVEDGSHDHSPEICASLAREFNPVVFYQHEDKLNHGAGATRNLGIKKARNGWIAFLDADDYYLPNRFDRVNQLIGEQNVQVDGIYECLGIAFENDQVKKEWIQKRSGTLLTTIFHAVPPDELLLSLLKGNNGSIHLNGLTVRKSCLEQVGLFSDHRISQDTYLILRLAATGKLVAGNIASPVAIRQVHTGNRITRSVQKNILAELQVAVDLREWLRRHPHNIDRKIVTALEERTIKLNTDLFVKNKTNADAVNLFYSLLKHPQLLFSKTGMKYMLAVLRIL